MDFNSLIERKRERFEQLEREIADPALFENRKRASDTMREHSSVKQLLARWAELETARQQLDDNRELAASNDVEIAAMADDEIPACRNASLISSATSKLRCCLQTKTRIATRSSKSVRGPEETKPRFSPPIFTGCTTATRNRPASKSKISSRVHRSWAG